MAQNTTPEWYFNSGWKFFLRGPYKCDWAKKARLYEGVSSIASLFVAKRIPRRKVTELPIKTK